MNRTAQVVLIVLLALLLIGMLPMWPYASPWGWGYYPSGGLFLLLIFVLALAVMSSPKDRRLLP